MTTPTFANPFPDDTRLSDVVVPEIFNPYFREASIYVNRFFRSGIMTNVPDLNFGNRGGLRIQMPFWHALSNRAQLLDENDRLAVQKVDTGKDEAVQHARALVYGASDLSTAFSGDDPMRAIADGVAENWSREFNMVSLASLTGALGALAAEGSPVNTWDISALSGNAAKIDGHSFIDATQTLGDAKVGIVAVAMHSAVEAALAKNDLIEFIRDSEGNIVMRTFMGKEVVVDDAMAPASGGVYTTILFGNGALGFGEGNPKVPTATDRDELVGGGQEFLVTRRHFVIHPRGIAWNPQSGVPAKATPSDAELSDNGNWHRVYQPKNIRLVRFVHKV
jgi:hypothetical protein